MHAQVATDLTRDTRVFLQGLEIGRLRSVVPEIDPETQQLKFLARLDIDVAFADGTQLLLPESTTAFISKSTPIAPPTIELSIPSKGITGRAFLEPGDTISSIRRDEVLDVLTDVAADLTDEIFATIEDLRGLISTSVSAITEVQSHVATTVPRVDSILVQISVNLAATQAMIEDVTPRIGIIQDSALATISTARTTIEGFDSLRIYVQDLAVENEASIEEIMQQLTRTAIILGHFADQISRRPTRILTGVTPPPEADSVANLP